MTQPQDDIPVAEPIIDSFSLTALKEWIENEIKSDKDCIEQCRLDQYKAEGQVCAYVKAIQAVRDSDIDNEEIADDIVDKLSIELDKAEEERKYKSNHINVDNGKIIAYQEILLKINQYC